MEDYSSDEEPPPSPTYGSVGRTTASRRQRNGTINADTPFEQKTVNLGECKKRESEKKRSVWTCVWALSGSVSLLSCELQPQCTLTTLDNRRRVRTLNSDMSGT